MICRGLTPSSRFAAVGSHCGSPFQRLAHAQRLRALIRCGAAQAADLPEYGVCQPGKAEHLHPGRAPGAKSLQQCPLVFERALLRHQQKKLFLPGGGQRLQPVGDPVAFSAAGTADQQSQHSGHILSFGSLRPLYNIGGQK